LGFYEGSEEILACAYNYIAAVAGYFNRNVARLCSGTLYIHAVLICAAIGIKTLTRKVFIVNH